jgi:hypothetical protein
LTEQGRVTDYWCFKAELSGQTLPLETGLEVVLGAQALSVEKTTAGNSLLQAWFEQEPEHALLDQVISLSVTGTGTGWPKTVRLSRQCIWVRSGFMAAMSQPALLPAAFRFW